MLSLTDHIWKEVDIVGSTMAPQVLLQQEAPLPTHLCAQTAQRGT